MGGSSPNRDEGGWHNVDDLPVARFSFSPRTLKSPSVSSSVTPRQATRPAPSKAVAAVRSMRATLPRRRTPSVRHSPSSSTAAFSTTRSHLTSSLVILRRGADCLVFRESLRCLQQAVRGASRGSASAGQEVCVFCKKYENAPASVASRQTSTE